MLDEEDIDILISQTGLNRQLAKSLLIFKNGDIVECILEFEKYSPHNLDELKEKISSFQKEHQDDNREKEVDISKRDNLIEYRNIVDEKDMVYNKKKELKEKMKKEMLENSKNTDTSDTTNTDETESQKICNESIYYSTRKNNINMIKVL